jgi:hypothetical protein
VSKKQSSSLISIEKFVAFILGPVVGAAGGLLSVVASKWAGVHVTQEAAAGVMMTGVAGGTATAYKWLDTKGKAWLLEEAERLRLMPKIDSALNTIDKDVPSSVRIEAEAKLRTEFHEVADKLHKDFEQKLANVKAVGTESAATETETRVINEVGVAPPPIPVAPSDPAPVTPPPPEAQPAQATQITVADQGAATQQ